MPKLSSTDRELLIMFGLEGLKFVVRAMKAAKARGADLAKLVVEAEAQNEKTIFDAIKEQGGRIGPVGVVDEARRGALVEAETYYRELEFGELPPFDLLANLDKVFRVLRPGAEPKYFIARGGDTTLNLPPGAGVELMIEIRKGV